jgi:hypothetical protein
MNAPDARLPTVEQQQEANMSLQPLSLLFLAALSAAMAMPAFAQTAAPTSDSAKSPARTRRSFRPHSSRIFEIVLKRVGEGCAFHQTRPPVVGRPRYSTWFMPQLG